MSLPRLTPPPRRIALEQAVRDQPGDRMRNRDIRSAAVADVVGHRHVAHDGASRQNAALVEIGAAAALPGPVARDHAVADASFQVQIGAAAKSREIRRRRISVGEGEALDNRRRVVDVDAAVQVRGILGVEDGPRGVEGSVFVAAQRDRRGDHDLIGQPVMPAGDQHETVVRCDGHGGLDVRGRRCPARELAGGIHPRRSGGNHVMRGGRRGQCGQRQERNQIKFQRLHGFLLVLRYASSLTLSLLTLRL